MSDLKTMPKIKDTSHQGKEKKQDSMSVRAGNTNIYIERVNSSEKGLQKASEGVFHKLAN